MSKPVAIILGGTNPHKALTENLKNRGYYTILIDYLNHPPAADVADEHIKESTLDKEKVLEVSKKKKADLVIATCVDQANVTACYVAEKLNLPHPYGYEAASEIADKTRMKKKMIAGEIPTSRYVILKSIDELNRISFNYPLVVKPSDTNGSKGVKKVENDIELRKCLKKALELSRNGKAVVEEFVEGDEVGIDCFVVNGKAHVITMHKKRKPELKDDSVIFSIGSLSPPPISQIAIKQIEDTANKIAKVFRLDNTPLLIQTIVANDDISVIEFAPRIGGGLNFRKIKLFADFDILSAAIDSFLNNEVNVSFKKPGFFYSENHVYTEPGVFGKIEGVENLVESEVILEFYLNKSKGMVINSGKASKDRIGSFIVTSDTIVGLEEKVRRVFNSLAIYDQNGKILSSGNTYKNLLFN